MNKFYILLICSNALFNPILSAKNITPNQSTLANAESVSDCESLDHANSAYPLSPAKDPEGESLAKENAEPSLDRLNSSDLASAEKDLEVDPLAKDNPESLFNPPTAIITPESCDMDNGIIDLTPDPWTPAPYTYEWSNGATTQDLINVSAGTYTVTITDANNQKEIATFTVGTLQIVGLLSGTTVANTLCVGGNGSIDADVLPTPGISFSYEWSTGETTQDISGLPAGTYTVTVTFMGTCTSSMSFTVAENAPTPNVNFLQDTAHCELANGALAVFYFGPPPPYTYLWSTGETTQWLVDILPGDYSVTVTAPNGCTGTGSTTLYNRNWIPMVEAVEIPNTTCIGGNASINLTVTPAAPPYSFEWSNGATTEDLTNLPAGLYYVTVTRDTVGPSACHVVHGFIIPDEPVTAPLVMTNSAATCGMSNGSANVSIIGGGLAPYSVLWSSGQTTQQIFNQPAGIYEVTVTGTNGCPGTASVEIADNPVPFFYSAQVTDQNSCDTTNGSIILTLSPSNLGFQWSNGATTRNLNNLAPGNYTVTVSAGGTCTAVETYNVGDVTTYPSIPAAATSSLCGLSNGAIDLTVNGGEPPFTYLWSNGMTTEDLVGVQADTFTVVVTTAVGCSAQNTVIVPNTNSPINILGSVADNISCATPTGYVALDISPIDTSYVFLWSNGQTTDSLANLSAGNYLVTVTLGLTCIALDTFVVANNATPPILSSFGTAANCSLNNGAAELSVNGGLAPYTFIWSNSATTEDLGNLLPGDYFVTVTGANSCTEVSSVSVLNNDIPLNINGIPVENTSCLTANGAVDISVSPVGTYTYMWSNSATTEDLNNLSAGLYTVAVNLGSCLSSSTFSITDNTVTPNLSSNITAAICSVNNGGIDLTVSGSASPPYAYLWSNSATTEDLANLLPGNYSVIVTAANGCSSTANLNVPNNASTFSLAGAASPLTNCVTDNGSIDLTISPAGAFTILWSNAATTEDLNGLAPGIYTVSVTESGSCTGTASFFVIDQRTNPVASPQTIVPELCGLADGSIDVAVSGGTIPYGYLWAGGQNSEDLANLAAGTYTLIVTDINGCTATTSAIVPGNSISFGLSGSSVSNTSCIQNNGSIDLTVNPVAPGYTYLWSNQETTADLTGLNAGNYQVTVSAGGNCTNTAVFNIINDVPSPLLSENITAAFCGQASGSIDLTVAGSPGPYNYNWSNTDNVEDLNSIVSGTYTVTVTAANGCTAVESIVVPENVITPTIGSVLTSATSCVTNNGAIDLTITPAAGPGYSFVWSNGSTTEDLNNVAAGNYSVTVNGGGACTNTAVLTVTSNVPPPSLSNNIAAATCGQASGSIDLSVVGSIAPYDFIWSNAATDEDLTALLSGDYSVTVTSANGCTATQSFVVPENVFSPTIGSNITSATSCVVNNGAIDLTITPPGSGPYTFAWSDSSSTEDLTNIAAGTYTVTVSAGAACTNTAVLTVISNTPSPSLSNNIAAATCGQASGSIDLSVTGSPAPYDYIWSNAATDEDLNSIVSGNYTVTVTSANGCTTVGNYTVQETTIVPDIVGSLMPANSCLTNNGAIDLTVTPALGYSFLWSNNSITEDLTNLAAGSYTVTVNGGGTCTNTASFLVADQTTQPQASIASNTTTLDCSTTAITLNGSVTGTPNATSTIWSSNGNVLGNGSSLSVNTPGQYDFVVVDNVTSCTATASIAIGQNLNPPALLVANPVLLTCTSPSQTLVGSSTVGGIQFAWAAIAGTDTTILGSGANLSISTPGTYYLFGINPVNNCTNAISVSVGANQTPPVADAGTTFTLDCAGETVSLDGTGSGGAGVLNYQWSSQDGHFVSGINTPNPLIDDPGTYQLLVTNPANGCTDTDEVLIEPEIPVAYASVVQPSCLNDKGTVSIDSITGLSAPILFSLNNGQAGSQSQFGNLNPGTYSILAQGGNGCNATVQAIVEEPQILDITLATEAEIDLGYSYQIDAQINIPPAEIETITWIPSIGLSCDNCLSPIATPFSSTEYELIVVSKSGCEARSELLLTVDKTRQIYVPNIFSPDQSSPNDILTIFADPVTVVKIHSFQVYSRWGEAVYERFDFTPSDPSTGWDGSLKGQKLNPAVFAWQAVVEFVDGKKELFKGDVTLLR